MLNVQELAAQLALITHDDGHGQELASLVVRLLADALTTNDSLGAATQHALNDTELNVPDLVKTAVAAAEYTPDDTRILARLARTSSALSALLGGLYAALSFQGERTIEQALLFACSAPDPDSVAAVTGALLGARHGYEALPTRWRDSLELGWVLDRLTIDLLAELTEHQGGPDWKEGFGNHPAVDPWWDTNYPGV